MRYYLRLNPHKVKQIKFIVSCIMTATPSRAGCLWRVRRELGGTEDSVFEGWEQWKEEKSWPDMMMSGAPCDAIMCNDLPFLPFSF
jgi:hypothetical protein